MILLRTFNFDVTLRMAQQNVQLRWAGPTPPRATPIAAEDWERHKAELCELYPRMKLEDLMALMKVRHRFSPS